MAFSQVLPKHDPHQWGLINAFGQNWARLAQLAQTAASNKGHADRQLDMIMVRWCGNNV